MDKESRVDSVPRSVEERLARLEGFVESLATLAEAGESVVLGQDSKGFWIYGCPDCKSQHYVHKDHCLRGIIITASKNIFKS